MFWQRQRPAGGEVPACSFCNGRHAPFDEFFSLISLLHAGFQRNQSEGRIRKLSRSCETRFPDAIKFLRTSAQPVWLRQQGLITQKYEISLDHSDIHFSINYMAARLAVSQFYSAAGRVLKCGTQIYTSREPYPAVVQDDLPDEFLSILQNKEFLKQGQWGTGDQFVTQYRIDAQGGIGVFVFLFQETFRATTFVLEDWTLPFPEAKEDDLFLVTTDCIQPVNGKFPADVKLAKRRKGSHS